MCSDKGCFALCKHYAIGESWRAKGAPILFLDDYLYYLVQTMYTSLNPGHKWHVITKYSWLRPLKCLVDQEYTVFGCNKIGRVDICIHIFKLVYLLCLFPSQLKILKCVSQCPGQYSSQQPIRGEPQHPAGALPDAEQPERELRCSAGGTPEPAGPSHRLQPAALLPRQVHYQFRFV